MNKIIIKIPEPNFRQTPGMGPMFISTIPPDIKSLVIQVDHWLILHLDLPPNKVLKEYLETIERIAKETGLTVKRFDDIATNQFIYSFKGAVL